MRLLYPGTILSPLHTGQFPDSFVLDAILTGAKKVSTVTPKKNGNQKEFEKMIVMRYDCPGIGSVKMTVGVKRRTHEKVQYCITAMEV